MGCKRAICLITWKKARCQPLLYGMFPRPLPPSGLGATLWAVRHPLGRAPPSGLGVRGAGRVHCSPCPQGGHGLGVQRGARRANRSLERNVPGLRERSREERGGSD